MKKIFGLAATLVALVVSAAAPAVAQDIDLLGESEKMSQGAASQLADVEVRQNDWRKGGISDLTLMAIVATLIESTGVEIAGSTKRILELAFEDDQLAGNKRVDTSGNRFKDANLKPAQVRYEINASGDYDSGSNRTRLGRDSIKLEHGSSTAFITVVKRDLATGNQITTITGRGCRSSTNLEGLNLASRFSWRGRGFPGFDYNSQSHRDPVWRRGMVAVTAALDDFEGKLKEYQRTGRPPKEDWRGRLPK